MSLKTLSKKIQDSGRGKDSLLVHMSPREVAGLQKLAMANGGSLTVNPETGLVEAGFLEQILPVVAAAAATYFTAGAAAPAIAGALGSAGMGAAAATTAGGILAGAGSGALISGTTAAIQGKDAGKAALMGGIGGAVSGGLGAYDAAPNLLNMGTTAPVPTESLTNVASNAPITADMAGKLGSTDTAQLEQLVAQNSSIVPQNVPMSQMTPEQFAAAGSSRFGAPVGAQDLSTGIGAPPASTLQNAAGAAKTLNTPSSYYGNLAPDSYFQKAGIQALPVLGLIDDEQQGIPTTPEEESKLKRISPNFRAQAPIQPNPYYNAQYPGFAGGGIMQLQGGGPVERMSMMNTAMNPQGGLYPQGMIDKTQYATPTQRPVSAELMTETPAYERSNPMLMNNGGQASSKKKQRADLTPESNLASYDAFRAALANTNNARNRAYMTGANMPPSAMNTLGGIPTAAGGGLADLGTYSDGGRMLKGRGDGMSDSIPGIIGGKQPARLADGEFVVPADVVSHLGNGSTDAGAKRLYAMMDKVRKARTGKKKQSPAVNAARFLPA
jgi:hypothetical protein